VLFYRRKGMADVGAEVTEVDGEALNKEAVEEDTPMD